MQSLNDWKMKIAAGCVFSAAEVLELIGMVDQLEWQLRELEEEHAQFVSSGVQLNEELDRLRLAWSDTQRQVMRVTHERNEMRNRLAQVAGLAQGR